MAVAGIAWSYSKYLRRGFTDFLPLYIGARLGGSTAAYDPEQVLAQQRSLTGFSNEALQWTRFPWVAVMLRPIAGLPYLHAWAFWVLLSALAYGLALRVSPVPLDILAAGYIPMWLSLMQGQDLGLVTLWVGLAARLETAGRRFVAGLVFALCSQKPHLFVLLPMLIVRQKMWRFGAGLLAGGLILTAISFAAGGRSWMQDWYRLVTAAPIDSGAHYMPNLASVRINHPAIGWPGHVTLIGLSLAAAWAATGKLRGFLPGLLPVLAGSLLVSRHCYLHDCAVLLPSLLAVERTGSRVPCRMLLWPFVFLLALAAPSQWVVLPAVLLILLLVLALGRRPNSPAMLLETPSGPAARAGGDES